MCNYSRLQATNMYFSMYTIDILVKVSVLLLNLIRYTEDKTFYAVTRSVLCVGPVVPLSCNKQLFDTVVNAVGLCS